MSQLSAGTVVFFNPSRGYGFIQSDAGERIFFHVKGQGSPRSKVHRYPYFGFKLELKAGGTERAPLVGDRVCFALTYDHRSRSRAYPWTYEWQWQDAQTKIEQRRFRVLRHQTVLRGKRLVSQSPEVVFEGTASAMAERYPRDRDDALSPVRKPTFRSECSFACLINNQWVRCEDPRRPLSSIYI